MYKLKANGVGGQDTAHRVGMGGGGGREGGGKHVKDIYIVL